MMLVNVKLDVTNFIGLFNFEWHGHNEVGNIGIRVCEKPCCTVRALLRNVTLDVKNNNTWNGNLKLSIRVW